MFDLYRTVRVPVGEAAQSPAEIFILDAQDWVTVVPALPLDDGRDGFLMVRQYRHGIERITTEFPAGLVERGEPAEDAARRELLEETGHEAAAVAHVATLGASPAFMNNLCHVYVAWGLRRVRDQDLDSTERIDLCTLPVDVVTAGMGRGELVNTVTAMSLHFYLGWKGADPRSEPARRAK